MSVIRFLFIGFIFLLTGCAGYKVEGNHAYWNTWDEGLGSKRTELTYAHIATFKILKHKRYAKDKNYAYFEGQIIQDADANTFRSIHEFRAVDRKFAYYGGNRIENADGKTFEFIQGSWARDSNDYYWGRFAIDVCDWASFSIEDIEFDWWATDKYCVFYQNKKLPIKDRESVVLFKGGYAKDKYSVYFQGKLIRGSDPDSFKLMEGYSHMARDRFNCYDYGVATACP